LAKIKVKITSQKGKGSMISCEIKKQLRDFELDIRFELGNGTLVIVGKSGCGKSTTLKAIAGLITPDQGRIEVGETIYFDRQSKINITPEDRGIGFLFQSYALFPHLDVFDNVAYGLAARKISKKEQLSRVEETLHSLGITHLSKSMPSELSGGEQQRVALARAIVVKPKLLMLDEPLSALDVTTHSRVRSELKKTLSALNIPSIIVTHDYEDAISLGERILVMDKGSVIQEGTANDLLTKPRSSFVADFSGTNYFAAHVLETKDTFIHLELCEGNKRIISRHLNNVTGDREIGKREIGQSEINFMVYPWDIQLFKKNDLDSKSDLDSTKALNGVPTNIFSGRVLNILSYGNRVRIELEASLPLTIELMSERLKELELREGDLAYAVIDPSYVHLLDHEGYIGKL
jgi:ABC-type Fe3+/spermidine/putrescine transport system ATPase subunit